MGKDDGRALRDPALVLPRPRHKLPRFVVLALAPGVTKKIGAGEGIRTLDPNLGKSQSHDFRGEPDVTSGSKFPNRGKALCLSANPDATGDTRPAHLSRNPFGTRQTLTSAAYFGGAIFILLWRECNHRDAGRRYGPHTGCRCSDEQGHCGN